MPKDLDETLSSPTGATPRGDSTAPCMGQLLGKRFQLLERLGAGGMGEVWRARDLQLDEFVAVKFLRPEISSRPEQIIAFKNEIRLARKVRHVNVAATYELHDDRGLLFITMEYVPGVSLATLLAKRMLEPAERLAIVQQIGLGLSAAHAHAIIHRDLKPHNVMVTPDHRVLILDFGLARSIAGAEEPQEELVGTPQYMAPEQVLGRALSAATDIYSFGVMLYELYAGCLPFVADTVARTALLHVEQEPRSLREIHAEIPAQVDATILSALSKNPALRPTSVGALVSQLERADVAGRWSATREFGAGLEEKKRLTLLRLELGDMSALAGELELTEVTHLRADLLGSLESVVVRFGGMVHRKDESSLLAVFSLPQVRENDAERALAAAREALAVCRRLGESVAQVLGVRAALHSGPLVVSADPIQGIQLLGEQLPVVDRLVALAGDGDVLVSEAFPELVAARFEPRRGATIRAGSTNLAVLALAPGEAHAADSRPELERFSGAIVGRRAEMATLLARLRSARSGEGSFVGVRGEAGIGKSRLVFEIAQRARELGFGILSGHCRTLDEQSTLQPVSQLLRAALEIPPDVEDPQVVRGLDRRLAPALAKYLPAFVTLLGGIHPVVTRLADEERLAFFAEALGALLALRAQERPLLLVVEDLHWIDPASAAIVERTVPRLRDLPILFISVYRPGFEPPWRDATALAEIELPALDPREQADLIRLRLEGRSASDMALDIVRDRAEGNPFFLEEMLKTLDETGTLEEGSAALAARIPPRIEEVILARIDRLESKAKEAIQSAAVIGRNFPVRLLDALVERSTADVELRELARSGLLYAKEILPELAYIFKHAVTRDVAYQTILEKRRRGLHRKLAQTIETLYADRLESWREVLAHHHEQAGNLEQALVYYHQSAADTRERVGDSAAAPLVGKESEVLEQMFRLRSKAAVPWRLVWINAGTWAAGALLYLMGGKSLRYSLFAYSILMLYSLLLPLLVNRERRNRIIVERQGLRGFLVTGQALRIAFEKAECIIPLSDIESVAVGATNVRWRLVSYVAHIGAVFSDREPVYVGKRSTRARTISERAGELLPLLVILAIAAPVLGYGWLEETLEESSMVWVRFAIPLVATGLGFLLVLPLQRRLLAQSSDKIIRRIEQAGVISFHPEQGSSFVTSLQSAIDKQRRDSASSASRVA